MRIQIESTSKLVQLNSVPARLWEGVTDSGIKVHCFITRIAIDEDEPRKEEFERELLEQKKPRPEFDVYPLRMIL